SNCGQNEIDQCGPGLRCKGHQERHQPNYWNGLLRMILLATRAAVDQSFKRRAISRHATKEEAMTKKSLIILAISTTLVLSIGTSAMATVTGILSDGCGGNSVCQPSFVSPVVAGKQMTVTVKGQ